MEDNIDLVYSKISEIAIDRWNQRLPDLPMRFETFLLCKFYSFLTILVKYFLLLIGKPKALIFLQSQLRYLPGRFLVHSIRVTRTSCNRLLEPNGISDFKQLSLYTAMGAFYQPFIDVHNPEKVFLPLTLKLINPHLVRLLQRKTLKKL